MPDGGRRTQSTASDSSHRVGWLRALSGKRPPTDCWVYVRQYCAKIDEAARNRMELIVPELAKRNGVTEKLKADTKWNGYGR